MKKTQRSTLSAARNVSQATPHFVGFGIGAAFAIAVRMSEQRVPITTLVMDVAFPTACFFMRILFLVMGPFIFFSVAFALGSLRAHKSAMGITARLFFFYAVTTSIAILIGQYLVGLIQPGLALPHEARMLPSTAISSQYQEFTNILDPILNTTAYTALLNGKLTLLILISILCGLITALLPQSRSALLLYMLRTGRTITEYLVNVWMHFAPAVIATITAVTILRLDDAFASGLLQYVAVVILGLTVQMFVVYPLILLWMGRYSFIDFLKRGQSALVVAFLSRSTSVTLPLTTKTLKERFGISDSVCAISVPLGINFNLNGTALFEAVTVVFLAQAFRIDLGFLDQVYLLFFVLITSIGIPGVPGSALPFLAACLSAFGIPMEGIGLIVGLDGLLGMFRSMVNLSGDMIGAIYLARSENMAVDLDRIRLPFQFPTFRAKVTE